MALDNTKKKIRAGVCGAIALLAAGTALAAGGTLNREGVRTGAYDSKADPGYCTVLVYMDGSDLESDYGMAASDLQEMQEAVAKIDHEGRQIHIVVEAGGSPQWQYEPMQDKQYGRFCITGQGVSEVEELVPRDMGRPDTLTDFIRYGTQSYPAEHYGLICWNHGAGQIEGFGNDVNFEESSLSIDELHSALAHAALPSPFDFIGMDACLMGNLELVCTLQKNADYLIASEELEPQYGYDYSWMEALKPGNTAGKPFGRHIGDSILASYNESYEGQDYKLALSLIDLNAYEQFHSVFHSLLDQVSGRMRETEFQQLGQQRSALLGFGSRSAGDLAEQVDMMDILESLTEFAADSDTEKRKQILQTLQDAHSKLVVSSISKGYSSTPSGLSMYLPGGNNDWLPNDMEVYESIGFCRNYHALVDSYGTYLMAQNDMEWRKPSQKQNQILLPLQPDALDQIADAYLAVFCENKDGEPYLLSADGDVTLDQSGFLKARPENVYWGLQGQILCLFENYDMEYETEYTAPILYKKRDHMWEQCNMSIVFSDDMPDGNIRAITPAKVSKQEYELEAGDQIIPLYPLKKTKDDSSNELDNYHFGNEISIQSLDNGDGLLEQISINNETKLRYGFLIRDTKMNLYYTEAIKQQSKK